MLHTYTAHAENQAPYTPPGGHPARSYIIEGEADLLFEFLHRTFAMCLYITDIQPPVELPCRDSVGNTSSPSVVYYKTSHLELLPVGGQWSVWSLQLHIYKPKPNFQIPYLHLTLRAQAAIDRVRQAQTSHASPKTQTTVLHFFSFLLCQVHAKMLCVWSSQPPTLQIQTKMALPDIPSRLMIRNRTSSVSLASARRLII
jgi:hypothetical protein